MPRGAWLTRAALEPPARRGVAREEPGNAGSDRHPNEDEDDDGLVVQDKSSRRLFCRGIQSKTPLRSRTILPPGGITPLFRTFQRLNGFPLPGRHLTDFRNRYSSERGVGRSQVRLLLTTLSMKSAADVTKPSGA